MTVSAPGLRRTFLPIFVLALLGALAWSLAFCASLDRRALDTGFQLNRRLFMAPVQNDPVIVGINEAFLDSIDEPLALSHVYLNRFLEAMRVAKPTAVGLDLVLPEKRFDTLFSKQAGSADLHTLLVSGLLQATRATTVVGAKVWDKDRGRFRDMQLDYAAVLGLQQQAKDVEPLASAHFCPDDDGVIRNYPGEDCQPGRSNRSLSSELSAAAGNRQHWSGIANFQIGPEFNYIPLQDVLKLAADRNDAELQTLFKDRIVLLGTVLEDTDLLDLPVALAQWRPGDHRTPGVVVHAQMLRSMLNRGFVQPTPAPLAWLLCGVFALFWLGRAFTAKLVLWLLASAALLAASDLLLWQGHWLAPGAIVLTGATALALRGLLELRREAIERRRMASAFAGAVSPAVMDMIVSGKIGEDFSSRKLGVCVLFCEIRHASGMANGQSAEMAVQVLNRYFERMSDVVHRCGGTVDKFVGGGMLAFFGAPNTVDSPEKSGLEAAHELKIELEALRRGLLAEQLPPMDVDIGVHSGEALVGHIGSPSRHPFTAIGDTVDEALRLAPLCASLGYSVVCSSVVAAAAGYPAFLVGAGRQLHTAHGAVEVFGWNPRMQFAEAAPC